MDDTAALVAEVDNAAAALVVNTNNTAALHSYTEADNYGFLDHMMSEDAPDEYPMKMDLNDRKNPASNFPPWNYYPPLTK